MPSILKTEAEQIADKLKSQAPKKAQREKFLIEKQQGSKHTLIIIYYGGIRIGQYGIRRGNKEQSHNFVPSQIYLSQTQAYNLAKCPLSVDDYIDILIERGEIEPSSEE